MLDKTIDEIVLDSDGKFVGVRSGEETVKAKQVIGDPKLLRCREGIGRRESSSDRGTQSRPSDLLLEAPDSTNERQR